MKNRIMSFLLVIALILVGYYHGGCIQTKKYNWQPTRAQEEEIIERAAQKMAEKQNK